MKKIILLVLLSISISISAFAGIRVQQKFGPEGYPMKVWEKILELNQEPQPLGVAVANNKATAANKARRDLRKVCECKTPAHVDYITAGKGKGVYAIAYIFPVKKGK